MPVDTTTTVQDLIEEVLLDCHAFKDGRTPSATLLARGLKRLNLMIKSWGADPMIGLKVRETLAVAANTASYTIGTAMVWATERPKKLLSAMLRDSANHDYSLTIIAREDWLRHPLKSNASIPEGIYFDEAWPTGTCYFDCAPVGAYTLYLESLKALATYATLATTVSLPEEYQEAIHWQLLMRMAPIYGHELSQMELDLAGSSLDKIKILRSGPVPQAQFDF